MRRAAATCGRTVTIANSPTCSRYRKRSRKTISGELAPGILSAEMHQARRKDPSQLGAWDLTMRAHWHIRRFTREDMAEARLRLEEAIALDPANSMALSDLCFAHHFEAVFGWQENFARLFARSGEMARGAVAADDGDAYAHTALAIFDAFSAAIRRGAAACSVPSTSTPTRSSRAVISA